MLPLLTDSYKLSHYTQYPKDMAWMQSYMESRGGKYEDIVWFGLQYYLRFMDSMFHKVDVDQLSFISSLAAQHGVPFNAIGWHRLVSELGYLPLKIYAVPEGSIQKPHSVLMTIESTDPESAWLVNYMETLLMKLWYSCTVATKAYHVRKIISKHYHSVGLPFNAFAYHNFGDRGSTSVEAAMIGGMAHLTQFMGTDNFSSLSVLMSNYGVVENTGFSIPATEHSTVTSWGKEHEHTFIENYIESFKGTPYKMVACVLDSYDLMSAVKFCCSLKDKVEHEDYPTLVMRPDSGNPLEIIPDMLQTMFQSKLSTTVQNGYILFDKYRIIWGDGISPEMIDLILSKVISMGYSPANIAFGSGGDLMQKVNRDTCKFAIKCCAIKLDDGTVREVYKEPKTDLSKTSKKGIQKLPEEYLRYCDGVFHNRITFDKVRENSDGYIMSI